MNGLRFDNANQAQMNTREVVTAQRNDNVNVTQPGSGASLSSRYSSTCNAALVAWNSFIVFGINQTIIR